MVRKFIMKRKVFYTGTVENTGTAENTEPFNLIIFHSLPFFHTYDFIWIRQNGYLQFLYSTRSHNAILVGMPVNICLFLFINLIY